MALRVSIFLEMNMIQQNLFVKTVVETMEQHNLIVKCVAISVLRQNSIKQSENLCLNQNNYSSFFSSIFSSTTSCLTSVSIFALLLLLVFRVAFVLPVWLLAREQA